MLALRSWGIVVSRIERREAQKVVSAIFQLCLNAPHNCTAPGSPKAATTIDPGS